jgi:hypothetical protein
LRRKLSIFISLSVLIFLLLSEAGVSAKASVGLKVGDWAKYVDTCVWNSENPEASEPDYVKDINNVRWRILTVEAISGTTITASMTEYFENDTQSTGTYSTDVATGKGDPEIGFHVVPPLLDKGDSVYGSGLRINYSTTKEMAGVNRDVNYAGMTIEIEGVTVFEYYWDKTTGILCSSATFDTYLSLGGYMTTTWIQTQIIETNIWSAENGPQPAGIEWWKPVIILIAISTVLVLIAKRYKPRKHK